MRIPKELGFDDGAQDVEVERVGNTLVLRRVEPETLEDLGEILAVFSPSFMAGGREFHEEQERDWSKCPGNSRLIAAHAVSVGIMLVTNDEADFKDYPGLVVENWVQPTSPPLPSKKPSIKPAKKPLKRV